MGRIISRTETILDLIPSGIICYESALAFHNLCTFSNDYIIMFTDSSYTLNRNQFVRFYSRVFSSDEGIVKFNDKFSITSPERTICEMILADRRDDFIIEALECYLYDSKLDINNLYSFARKCHVYPQLMSYIYSIGDIDDELSCALEF